MTKGVLGGGNRERRQRGAKQLETGGVTGRKRVCVARVRVRVCARPEGWPQTQESRTEVPLELRPPA